MSKQPSSLEWHIAQDEVDWERLCGVMPDTPPDVAPVAQGRRHAKWLLWGMATLLFLLVSEGGGWSSTPPQLQQGEGQVHTTAEGEVEGVVQSDDLATLYSQYPVAQQERWMGATVSDPFVASVAGNQTAPYWRLLLGREGSSLRAVVKADEPEGFDLNVGVLALRGDQAMARVVMYTDHGEPAYRQTRFYRRTAAGSWQQTLPDPPLWGLERSLETPSFVFRFRQNDATAVIAVAPQMEALYTTLRHNFGLPITSSAEKRVIEVSVTQTPGYATPWFGAPERILVPSPAVYLAPVELTNAEILAQSLALPLLAQVSAQASEQYQIDAARQPLLNGLRLWQLWDLDLPLAAWREDVVQWLYVDSPRATFKRQIVQPDHYEELCAAYTLWLLSPVQLGIPLFCTELDGENWYYAASGSREPLLRLDQLTLSMLPDEYVGQSSSSYVPHPGQTVALATLIEYAVATYGRERLPALLAGLGKYESWETLLPAVYGVSPAEFEAGWQAYLTVHYGVP